MKATILCGSADPEGVTDSMCRCADEYLRSKGYQVDLFRLGSMDIGHCRDCDGCAGGRCIIEDDMSAIYDSYHGSDLMILASPIHFSGPSSLIKTRWTVSSPYGMTTAPLTPQDALHCSAEAARSPILSIRSTFSRHSASHAAWNTWVLQGSPLQIS